MAAHSDIDKDTLRSVIDTIALNICVLNRDLGIEWVNQGMHQWLGRDEASPIRGGHCYREIFGRGVPCEGCPALRSLETGRSEFAEAKIEKNGETRYYLITTTPLRTGGKKVPSFLLETIQETTAQKLADEKLKRILEFNRQIIHNAPVAIFTIDQTGGFTSVNPELAALSGLGAKAEEKLVGFNWLSNPYTIQCGLANHIQKGLQGEAFQLFDFPFVTYRGDRSLYMDFKGVPLKSKDGKVEGLLCIIEETTDKVKARAQLIQDAKMSVIGRLTTGVAHELNNPLATIAANSELACELFQTFADGKVGKGEMDELRNYLEVIQDQAFRCKKIIKDMFDLTRVEGFEENKVDLRVLLNDLLQLVNLRKLKIRLKKEIPRNPPHARGDLNALRQCFLNILHNAIDAVEGREGPSISLRVFPAGEDAVRIEIEDNGSGIHDSLTDKIFEPFFSTKTTGKGIGLGLTLCYDFLNKMGGKIEVESKLGRGSVFKVTLPVYRRIHDTNTDR
jgi:PAS domain S-box-containing protein